MKRFWQHRSARERQCMKALGLFMAIGIAYAWLWLPAQRHLADAQLRYLHQVQLQQALAATRRSDQQPAPVASSLASLVGEKAAQRGVVVREMDLATGVMRLTASAEALALLAWLAELEHAGAQWHALELTREGGELTVRLSVSDT